MVDHKANLHDYSGIWVFCEQHEGCLTKGDFELVSEARRLADELQTQVGCLLLADELTSEVRTLGGYGADQVYVYRHDSLAEYTTEAYADIVCQAVLEKKPEILLFGATKIGRDLAPRCAARLGTGLTADCTRLDIDEDEYLDYLQKSSTLNISREKENPGNRELKMTRPAFGGHLMATIVCPNSRPCMSTVRPGVFKCAPYDEKRAAACLIHQMDCNLDESRIRTKVLAVVHDAVQKVEFEGADVIVSVGRGISTDVERGLQLARDLSEVLGGGPIGGSRVIIDNGWLPEAHQIGQTGKTVHPKLYVAMGISGAMQHLVGITGSEYILAVNKNPEAPIFSVADYGISGDLFKVVPILIEEIQKVRNENLT